MGSRYYANYNAVYDLLSDMPKTAVIVHGGHWSGADCYADLAASKLGLCTRVYRAHWTVHGKSAGPIRNAQMIKMEHLPGEPIDHVYAFSDIFARHYCPGTMDMIAKAEAAHIPVTRCIIPNT